MRKISKAYAAQLGAQYRVLLMFADGKAQLPFDYRNDPRGVPISPEREPFVRAEYRRGAETIRDALAAQGWTVDDQGKVARHG